ncbi:Vam6 protein [Martiniozyma asiatica (nom. inval.)]|nr:Vam6 protein [Martiniozyma asiatica]
MQILTDKTHINYHFKRLPQSIVVQSDDILVAQSNCVNRFILNSKEPTSVTTRYRVKQLHQPDNLNLLIVVYDNQTEFWKGETIIYKLNLNLSVSSVVSWSNYTADYTQQSDVDDPNITSDSVSFATAQDTESIESEELKTMVAFIADDCVVIYKFVNGEFTEKLNLHLANVCQLQFQNSDEAFVITSTDYNDLIHINLNSGDVVHNDLTDILHASNSTFFNNNYVIGLISAGEQLIIIKSNEIIKLNSNLKCTDRVKLRGHLRSSYFFPFLLLQYPNKIELRSLSNLNVLNILQIKGIVDYSITPDSLAVLTIDGALKYHKLDYNSILDQFYDVGNYADSINLIHLLHSSYFSNDSMSANQMKFITLRKFEILKGKSFINIDFQKSMDILAEYLAPPKLVLDAIPEELKLLISTSTSTPDCSSEQSISSTSQPKYTLCFSDRRKIHSLTSYLTDIRRKLLRLLEHNTSFKWQNYEVSLLVFKIDDPSFSIIDNLKIVDDYLFNCYLLLGSKLIGSFLRLRNFCSIEIVEGRLNETELIDFYFARNEHDRAIKILKNENNWERLTLYLKKMIISNASNTNSILKNLANVDDTHLSESFQMIFQNDSIAYEDIDKKIIINWLNDHENLLISYLEFIVFNLHDYQSTYINTLLENYIKYPDENFEKIIELYATGNYTTTSILQQLSKCPKTNTIERLKIDPLSRQKKYNDVLHILVPLDLSAAVDFLISLPNDKRTYSLIHSVLDILAKPSSGSENQRSQKVNQFITDPKLEGRLDPSEIVRRTSDDMGLDNVEVITVLRSIKTRSANVKVKEMIGKRNVGRLNSELASIKSQSKWSNGLCKCGRKLGDVGWWSQNGIVHYGCQ